MTMTTTTTMTTTIETTTTRTLKNLTSCTSSWFSKDCRQWTSCSLKSFFEFWTMHALSITFEKSRRSSRTRSSTNQFQSTISKDRFTSWNKKRFAWFAKSTTNERIFFFRRFLRFEMFFKFDHFDQLNEIRCFMLYKSNLFTIEEQDIITRKRVNNVFFFEFWKHVNYNFIITFIVDNFVETFVELFVNDFSINKKILSIWHARLRHLKEQNVERFIKMSNKMNLIKLVAKKNSCESCIVIKQKIESHNNFVILDKHFLNLMWSDLV